MKRRNGALNLNIQDYQINNRTAAELFNEFLEEKKAQNLAKPTLINYKNRGEMFIGMLSNPSLPAWQTCTEESYKNYILKLQNKGTKDVTIASNARSIRAWFYWMMDNSYIKSFKVIVPRFQKTIPETYTDEELEKLLREPSPHCTEVEYETWIFINLAIATGLRLSSILHLHVSDITFEENRITVNSTKSNHALVLIANDELLSLLKKYICLFRLSGDDFLFATGEGTMYANRTMEDFVKRYSTKRGVTKKRAIHAFRHTFARNFYLQNHDMYRLKELMGHTLISTTEHYLLSLGLDTSTRIEYNPQAQFLTKKSAKTHSRRGKISKSK